MVNDNTKKLTKNVIFSIINSLATLLFPIITYPYVSRVLLPVGIGKYNLAYGVLEYFILFAQLGIPLFGTRLVAKVKNDSELLKEKCGDIFTLNVITTMIAFSSFLTFAFFNPATKANFLLYFVIGFQLISFCLNVEWYYQGIENFRFIALKNVVVKVVCIVLIFLLVNSQDDVLIYAMIMMFSVLAYSIINFIYFLHETKMRLSFRHLKSLIKSMFIVFFIYAASKINSNVDVVMLGFMTGEAGEYNVGIYTNSVKIINMVISLITAVNLVVLPRVVSVMNNDSEEKAFKILRFMFNLIFLLSVIMSIGLYFVSEEIIIIFSGENFIESLNTMKLMCVNVFLGTITNFLGVQVLYSKNKELYTAIAIIVGTVFNIIVNSILIPKYLYFGAGIATVVSNSIILLVEALFCIKKLKYIFVNIHTVKAIIISIIFGGALWLYSYFVHVDNHYLSLLFTVIYGVGIFALLCIAFWFKDFKRLRKGEKTDGISEINENEN